MRSPTAFILLSSVTLASLFSTACGTAETASGGNGGGGGDGGGAGGGPNQSGIPCDVAKVLADHCLSCHGEKPSAGAPVSLVTYADLTAPSAVDPAISYVARAVIRMGDSAEPMPPSGGSTPGDVAILQSWIQAGTPKGDCTEVVDPFSLPVGCQSGKKWNPAQEGANMNPGEACITCHTKSGEVEAPIFTLAGTVYPAGHEEDLCYGINGQASDYSDVVVQITDANQQVYNLKPGATGNFSLLKPMFAFPYTAKVLSSKGERAMSEAQTEGDCNLCHTVNGAGNGSKAPGRIVVPY